MPPLYPLWTPYEDSLLHYLRSRGESWMAVSKVLGRGVHACRKRSVRQFGNDDSVRKMWSPQEDATLDKMRASGRSWQQISRTLGRTHRACRARHERRHSLQHGAPHALDVVYYREDGRYSRSPRRSSSVDDSYSSDSAKHTPQSSATSVEMTADIQLVDVSSSSSSSSSAMSTANQDSLANRIPDSRYATMTPDVVLPSQRFAKDDFSSELAGPYPYAPVPHPASLELASLTLTEHEATPPFYPNQLPPQFGHVEGQSQSPPMFSPPFYEQQVPGSFMPPHNNQQMWPSRDVQNYYQPLPPFNPMEAWPEDNTLESLPRPQPTADANSANNSSSSSRTNRKKANRRQHPQ